MASVDLRLTRLESVLNRCDEVPAGIVLSVDGIHDAAGMVIDLPAVSDGTLSVILCRGPEPAPTRPASAAHTDAS